jgi:hypothetical protein
MRPRTIGSLSDMARRDRLRRAPNRRVKRRRPTVGVENARGTVLETGSSRPAHNL